jgi:hypothetical protein
MKGSLTVELSLLFPLLFISFILVLQGSLYVFYRLYTQCLAEQSFMVCEEQRRSGETPETSMQRAKEYLLERTAALPVQIEAANWHKEEAWFKESYTIKLELRYRFLISLPWTVQSKDSQINPVRFKNRVDFLWEKGKVFLENHR